MLVAIFLMNIFQNASKNMADHASPGDVTQARAWREWRAKDSRVRMRLVNWREVTSFVTRCHVSKD